MTESDGTDPVAADAQREEPRRRLRAVWWIAGVAACAVALGGGGMAAMNAVAAAPESVEEERTYSTATVDRGTLSGTRTVPGTLDYQQTRAQGAGVGGVLTDVPDPGATLNRGDSLYRIDNVPVFLFIGALPAWRSFDADMADGPDVAQLEANLRDLGFFAGEPDEDFNWETKWAVYEWQKATGQEKTGTVDLGRIVFSPTALRVAELTAAVGDRVAPGAPVMQVSGLTQEVTADLKLADQKLGAVGAPVEIQLPGGVSTTGKIAAVGQPTERESNGQTSVVVPLRITLDDPKAAAGIQRANVTIDIPSESKEDVLSVPLDALIALPGGEFGVEVVQSDGTVDKVAVVTGLFAGGRVEVSGDGIDEGVEVVVPEK